MSNVNNVGHTKQLSGHKRDKIPVQIVCGAH